MLGRLDRSPSREACHRFRLRRGKRVRVEHDGPTVRPFDDVQIPGVVNALELLTDSRTRSFDSAAILQPPRRYRVERVGPLDPFGMAGWRNVILESGGRNKQHELDRGVTYREPGRRSEWVDSC
jgi:hypothetical protein